MKDQRILGQDGAREIGFNLDLLMRGRLLIQGSSGSGKSETVKKICAATQNAVPSIIIDPEGEYAPLRASMPFLLIGPGGEVPAAVETAELVAHRLLETGASAICDLYELGHARGEWVRRFLVALDTAPKALRRECLLFVDEAHMFAPEQGNALDAIGLAVADIASRGRKRGIGLIVVTQRLALLSNHIIGLCENLLIGRTGLLDAPRTAKLFAKGGAQGRDFIQEIGRIGDGQFYAYGRAFGLMEPTLFQVERVPGQTLEKASRKGKRQALPTPEQLKDLLPKFADLPAEVKAKEETFDALRSRIRELEKASKPSPATPTVDQETLRMLQETLKMLTDQVDAVERNVATIRSRMSKAREIARQLAETLAEDEADKLAAAYLAPLKADARRALAATEELAKGKPAPMGTLRAAAKGRMQVPAQSKALPEGEQALSTPEQRVLDAIAWFEGFGITAPRTEAVAFIAGYKPVGGAFGAPKASLGKRGFIVSNRGTMELSEAGRPYAKLPEIEASNAGIQQAVMDRFGEPERKILAPLLKAWPEAMATADVAAAAGYNPIGGAFGGPRAALIKVGAVESVGRGLLKAADLLFPEGV